LFSIAFHLLADEPLEGGRRGGVTMAISSAAASVVDADGAAVESAAASSSTSAATSGVSGTWSCPNYVRVVLLAVDGKNVLMERLEDSWDMPYFTYPAFFEVEQLCDDVRQALAPDSDGAYFSVNCDLFGVNHYPGRPPAEDYGVASLLLMECHGHDLKAASKYEWKDAAFVTDLLSTCTDDRFMREALQLVSKLLCGDPARVAAFLQDPRFMLGWFDKAASWFRSVVASTGATVCGRVVQTTVSINSTTFKVPSTSGEFYLKAVGVGSQEVEVTKTVAFVFPDITLALVDSHGDLNCFVSRAFSPPDEAATSTFALLLGRLQVDSVQLLAILREGQFPDCSPMALAAEMLGWMDDDLVCRWFGRSSRHDRFVKYVHHLAAMCDRLTVGNVPGTLVHGDASPRNTALTGADGAGKPILFDWEFACIGHPFYDWHELHGVLSKEARLAYLGLFNRYGAMEELQSLYDAGRTLGWCMKMSHVLKRARLCDMELGSTHKASFLQFWEHTVESLMDVAPPGVPEDDGPKWSGL